MSTEMLWAVHVEGPDDVFACSNKEVAEVSATALNKIIDYVSSPLSPICRATVIEWPHDPESWAADLLAQQ